MRHYYLITFVSLSVATLSERIRIDVGSNGAPALRYTPDTVTAKEGDIIDFHFIDENVVSSVLKGVETQPCMPSIDAGFFNSAPILGDPTGSNVFSVNVTSNEQMILYCGVAAHCKAGMVAVVNPARRDTLKNYAEAAKLVKMSVAPPMMSGGIFTPGIAGGPVGGPPPGAGAAPPAGGAGASVPALPSTTLSTMLSKRTTS